MANEVFIDKATELANRIARDIGKLSREDAADLVQRLKHATGDKR